MSRKDRGNWVDRGEPAIPKLKQALVHYFERFDEDADAFVAEHATFVYGMVAADATDVQIASYLRAVVRDVGFPARQPLGTRLFAISMWHIAKVALVRDAADHILRRELPASTQTSTTLGNWLAHRLMTPEELSEYQRRADIADAEETLTDTDSAYAD